VRTSKLFTGFMLYWQFWSSHSVYCKGGMWRRIVWWVHTDVSSLWNMRNVTLDVNSVFGLLHRRVVGDVADISEVHSSSIFGLNLCRLVCTTFYCSYWPRRGTSPHSISPSPVPFANRMLYMRCKAQSYTLRPWRWRRHIPPKRRNIAFWPKEMYNSISYWSKLFL
jgi:hypothetical protein